MQTKSFQHLKRILDSGQMGALSALWGHSQFGGIPLPHPPPAPPGWLDGEEELVFDLLFRAKPVDFARAISVLGGECVTRLRQMNVLVREGAALRSTGLRMHAASGFELLAGVIPGAAGSAHIAVHLGQDSLIMAEMIRHWPRVRNALDLCAGGGILSLCLSPVEKNVTPVELLPVVAEVARLNISLAGAEETVHVSTGDLFHGAGDAPFDLIVCNPPFAATGKDPASDRVGAGGIDGLDVARRVWREAPAHLSEHGRLLIIAGMLGDARGPFVEDEMRQVARENGWQMRLLQLGEPVLVNELRFTSLIPEDRVHRVEQKLDAARILGATHDYVGVVAAWSSTVPDYARTPVFAPRGPQMREAIKELRDIRNRASATPGGRLPKHG